ncbi:hypothetical protein [Secundilactobacillus kimchicus]|uniref:hypothetical protein n=1 Tax=Secundilactobacillus kimchicus TaxID=528209 RepID=UPI0024A888F8|nr:hypothetical protein [Secundilactobacillus kimchicus]
MANIKAGWHWWREHGKVRRLSYLLTWLVISGSLVVGALLAPHMSNIDDSPVNQYLDFSGDNPAAIRMTKKAYNPSKQRLVLWFNIKSGTSDPSQQVIDQDVGFKVETLADQGATVTVVPTTTNHFVLLIDHLTNKFMALQVTVTNNTPQSAAGGTVTRGGHVAFVVNEKPALTDPHLPQLTREQYATQAVSADIQNEADKQTKKRKLTSQAQAAITADQGKIQALEKELPYQTASEKDQTQDAVDSLKQDQKDNQQTIQQAGDAITASQAKVKLLQAKQAAIADGSYSFPVPQKTQKIKR